MRTKAKYLKDNVIVQKKPSWRDRALLDRTAREYLRNTLRRNEMKFRSPTPRTWLMILTVGVLLALGCDIALHVMGAPPSWYTVFFLYTQLILALLCLWFEEK